MVTFIVGILLLTAQLRHTAVELPSREMLYSAVVTSEPISRGKVLLCDLALTEGELAGHKLKASIYAKEAPALHLGDGVMFISELQRLSNYRASNFDYVRWLRTRGFVARAFILPHEMRVSQLSVNALPMSERFALAVNKLRQRLLGRYLALGLSEQDYAVVAAMTLGDKSMLDSTTKESYSVTGASHILAVSGLHLNVIFMLLTLPFWRTRRTSMVSQAMVLPALWAYAALTGLSPSVVRAALMLTVYTFAGMLGRERLSLNVLALTATVLLVSEPLYLWDISFQMSFLAILGITLFYRPLSRLVSWQWLQHHCVLRWVWNATVLSVAAQLLTAPIVAYYFERFSCYSLLVNLVAIPAATVIIYLSAAFFVATPLPPLQEQVARMLASIADYLNHLLLLVTRLPGASVEHLHVSTPQLFGVYGLLLCACVALRLARTFYYSRCPWQSIPVDDITRTT